MHLVLVIRRQNAGWKVLALSGLAGFVLWDVYVHLDIPMLCCFHSVVFWHRSSHLNLLALSSVIIQVPACHHLNMRNSNCRPKSNSLVKCFVLGVLWDREYQMSVGLLEVLCVCLCSLWGVRKAVLSSLLTFQATTPVFVHSLLLLLLYLLLLKTGTKCGVLYIAWHIPSRV